MTKKHYYYLLVSEGRVTDALIVKAYSKKQIKEHALNAYNVVARYEHYSDAETSAKEMVDVDSVTGQALINYTSLTGVDYVD